MKITDSVFTNGSGFLLLNYHCALTVRSSISGKNLPVPHCQTIASTASDLFLYLLPLCPTIPSMAGFWGAKADSSRQASSSVPASIAGVGRSFKRKREGDDVGSPLILASDSESSKRQKHGIGCYDASAIGRGGEDVGSRRVRLLVHQLIYEHDTGTNDVCL